MIKIFLLLIITMVPVYANEAHQLGSDPERAPRAYIANCEAEGGLAVFRLGPDEYDGMLTAQCILVPQCDAPDEFVSPPGGHP